MPGDPLIKSFNKIILPIVSSIFSAEKKLSASASQLAKMVVASVGTDMIKNYVVSPVSGSRYIGATVPNKSRLFFYPSIEIVFFLSDKISLSSEAKEIKIEIENILFDADRIRYTNDGKRWIVKVEYGDSLGNSIPTK